MTKIRAAVVGGGIVGLAVARQLLIEVPNAEVVVFEKEDLVASHQTGHNSGVVHAGLYYEPGSLKARLCRRGVGLLAKYAADKGVPYEECGKIVVAQNMAELDRLHTIHARAQANGVPDIRMIDAKEIAEIEPHARGVAALHSPHTAIVDYVGIGKALAADIVTAGGTVLLGHEVTSITPETALAGRTRQVAVTTRAGTERFDLVITCAGLQSDRVATTAGDTTFPKIVPFFGDYFLLSPEKASWVNGLIYPVPDPKYPFLGVHLTKRFDGAIMLGPNAFLSLGREAYRPRDYSFRDIADAIGFGGFWRFASQNLPAAARESRTVLSTRSFVNEACKYVPGITMADVHRGPRGIRAQAMNSDGSLEDDFVISGNDRVVHVRNAPSPGATSSLAIAEHVVQEALDRAGLS
ncbi:L-2-hydroxyglutarate oxidase [Rhodococcus erythropolis]|uniref:L-2-hydroxyglutarate oxidase n=1 Tax=Rhodococcus erythropolis TaxID=1833 RepID=UPI0008A5CD2B|nr:L-2-hydroxyglutarate oxidase [Rhodococcus erythropolis]MBT1258339.1 L-2-hydroxyglutarate oxidase [Rhodococcus erythropolis]OHF24899.1 hydroxyglutarate oxidase [Rhodococcus erythropolis]